MFFNRIQKLFMTQQFFLDVRFYFLLLRHQRVSGIVQQMDGTSKIRVMLIQLIYNVPFRIHWVTMLIRSFAEFIIDKMRIVNMLVFILSLDPKCLIHAHFQFVYLYAN